MLISLLLCWPLGPHVGPLPSESQWAAVNLPCGCLGARAIRTLVSWPTLQCTRAPRVMSVTFMIDWLRDRTLRHCATTCYLSSSTHPWRLVRSLWLWMHGIPFLLQVHVECAINIEWKSARFVGDSRGREKVSWRCWWSHISLSCLQGIADTSWLNPVLPDFLRVKSWSKDQQLHHHLGAC